MVSKTGSNGQVITKTGGSTFSFTNDGIRRVFQLNGIDILDFTTNTESAITITGATRANRIVNGGVLRVTNNISNVYCDYVPSNVTWNTTNCNCAVSGTWSGSCSDSTTSSVEITGCGAATVTASGTTQNVTFDRCFSN
jgi:hypothetical protein